MGVAQLVRAPDCGSGCRGFESLYPPHKTMRDRECPDPSSLSTQGCRQVVRQGTLTPSSAGSSPAVPARNDSAAALEINPTYRRCDPVAQSAEQLPFKQWVRGSNPRRVTTKDPVTFLVTGFFAPLRFSAIRSSGPSLTHQSEHSVIDGGSARQGPGKAAVLR